MRSKLMIFAVLAMTGSAWAVMSNNPETFDQYTDATVLWTGSAPLDGWEGWGEAGDPWQGGNDWNVVSNPTGSEGTVVCAPPGGTGWGYNLLFNHDNEMALLPGNPAPTDTIEVSFDVIAMPDLAGGIIKIELYDDAARGGKVDAFVGDPTDFVIGRNTFTVAIPAGKFYITPVIGCTGPDNSVELDNIFIGLEGTYTGGVDPLVAKGGNPNGGFANPDTTTELTWTNPTTIPTSTEIYFIESDTIFDPNITSDHAAWIALDAAELLAPYASCADACDSASVTLTEGKYYAWRVLCDGNASGDWIFNTINTDPTVSAGPDQNAWLASNTVDVTLAGSANDADGYPGDPLTYAWTQTAGASVGAIATVTDPTITFTVADTYVFQLEASDGLDSATDEVTINVYAETDTRLVAHWKFEDNLDATVGTGINGTAAGTNPVAYVNGIPADNGPAGKALSLDGTNYVEILSTIADPTILHYDDQITVSAWIRSDGVSFGPQWAGVVTKGDSSWRVAIDGGGASAEFACTGVGNNQYGAVSGVQTINNGNWHHVVGVYDGAQINIYIDGVLDTTEDASDPIAENLFGVVIGANNEATGRAVIADIDEVRIFDKGLTAARVFKMFEDDGGTGACAQNYAVSDFNGDCRTDGDDLVIMAAQWLNCTDITGVNCN